MEKLYEQYAPFMYRIAFGILQNKQDAEDCVHDTVIRIVENLERFENAEKTHLQKLIAVCCRNISLDRYRANRTRGRVSLTRPAEGSAADGGDVSDGASREEYEFADPDESLERIVINEENARYLRSLVQRLPAHLRDVIEMRYFLGMTVAEIARALDISEAFVRTRVSRAKKKLLQMGGEQLYDIWKE